MEQNADGVDRFLARAAYHRDSELSAQVVRSIAKPMRVIHGLTIAAGDSQIPNTCSQFTGEEVSHERALEALVALGMNDIRA
jgi:hypothetical protein